MSFTSCHPGIAYLSFSTYFIFFFVSGEAAGRYAITVIQPLPIASQAFTTRSCYQSSMTLHIRGRSSRLPASYRICWMSDNEWLLVVEWLTKRRFSRVFPFIVAICSDFINNNHAIFDTVTRNLQHSREFRPPSTVQYPLEELIKCWHFRLMNFGWWAGHSWHKNLLDLRKMIILFKGPTG